ncbi:aminopeptidase [Ruminococcus sp. OA3]|nr:aminopeptidase [Ruminococcus sp. OA3]
MNKKSIWTEYNEDQKQELNEICEKYKDYLTTGKTERECVSIMIKEAEACGYRNLKSIIQAKEKLNPQDRVYIEKMGKSVLFFQVGEESLEQGMNILGAHIDSPRLDVKQVPLYEKSELAYLDAHYYGGIKKYQWLAIPLAIHGVVVKKDGTVVNISIGEKESDPVFVMSDLLVHLSSKQMKQNAGTFIDGEQMDLLIGNMPIGAEEKESVKLCALNILSEAYGIAEEDFMSAELEIVPAGAARDCGLDRSMVMGYGQDDRVCAFTSFMAMMELKKARKTCCCILTDKEEIGSVGATGMHSRFFENAVAELLECSEDYSELRLRRALENSKMMSSDVSAAYDPMYADVFEDKNSAYFSRGIVLNKYTGSRGKSGSNDANPEYIAALRAILDKNGVYYQTAELGRVDAGGGGTIAYIMANYGMNVIDCGVAVLCMHAPWEVASKADIYEAVKCYRSFLKEA